MEKRQILTLTVVRQRGGLIQSDLALAIGCSQTEISRWEKGMAIPPAKAQAIIAVIRSHSKDAIPSGLKLEDLSRPWDDVLLGFHSSLVEQASPAKA